MKLFLVFSGEGPTDNRFLITIIERLIENYLILNSITIEISWIEIRKRGSSKENILLACRESKSQDIVFFHRDADNNTWQEAYNNHFAKAIEIIQDDDNQYNKNLIPIIPVKEIEAWMLCNKSLLKDKIGTDLPNNQLSLNYRINLIEHITDPKHLVQNTIMVHNSTLTRKQRRYAMKIGDLYDLIANEIPLSDLENLNSFRLFKKTLIELLNSKFNLQ